MLSSGDNVSSKRVMGILCILIYIQLLELSILIPKITISDTQENLMTTLFYGGLLLFGAAVVEKFKKL